MKIEDTVKSASGLYTVAEAALYAKMPSTTLAYWLYGDKSHPALRGSIIPKTEGRYLTFLEFVEALAVRSLRNTYGLSLQKIRGALDEAKQQYGVEYPFADREHETFLSGDDLHIIVGNNPNPVQLTGKHKRQQCMRQCIEQFMRDLQFDDQKTASSYIAYRYPVPDAQRTVNITMNPRFCFGDPVVEGTGHRAETLWKATVAEGSEQRAAELFEVKLDEVIAACRYCDDLEMAA